jgi:hypothetical protein
MGGEKRTDIGPRVFARIEERAARLGLTVHRLATLVGMDPSVPHRWKGGTTPSLRTYLDLETALDRLEPPPAGRRRS